MNQSPELVVDGPEIMVDLSDLHCGSELGLMPPRIRVDSGNVLTHGDNIHQIWLWERWQEFERDAFEIIGKSRFVLVLNGDMTEGVHHGGKELVAIKKSRHFQIAREVLAPWVKRADKTFFVRGTECHTEDMEGDLAEVLGGVKNIAKNKWLFEIGGFLVDAAHHVGTTSRAYLEASAMSINAGNALLNQLRAGHRTARIFLRGHRHCGGCFDDGHAMVGITPAWQFLTRHGWKVVPDSIPRTGGLIFDWRSVKRGRMPMVHKLFYDPPQDEIIKC